MVLPESRFKAYYHKPLNDPKLTADILEISAFSTEVSNDHPRVIMNPFSSDKSRKDGIKTIVGHCMT